MYLSFSLFYFINMSIVNVFICEQKRNVLLFYYPVKNARKKCGKTVDRFGLR